MTVNAAQEVPIADVQAVAIYYLGSPISIDPIRQTNPITDYIISSKGTLIANLVIAPAVGVSYSAGCRFNILWNCNITADAYSITIADVDFTAVLSGEVNTYILLEYDGATWQVVNIDKKIITALSTYVAPVVSVAGKTGVVTLVKSDVGLPYVDNTSDNNKPVSIAQGVAIANAQSAAAAYGIAAQGTADTALINADNALAQLLALTTLVQIVAWAAATQTIQPSTNLYAVNVAAVNGNVVLNVTGLTGATANTYSEIKVVLNFTGSYTVTAGTGCQFGMLTGTASTTQVLRLIWTGTTYVQA